MGRIVVTEFISLDGVIEAPGGGEDFEHGGWTFEIDRGAEGDKFKLDELLEAEAQLLGRRTYEGFAAAWPQMNDEAGFAEKMNTMPKYVVSSTLQEAELGEHDGAQRRLRRRHRAGCKQEVDGVILVAGSAQLVQGLIEHDLVDELRLMVFPVVLGSGKRLFGPSAEKTPLKLTGSETVGDGIAILTYERGWRRRGASPGRRNLEAEPS